MFHNLDINKAYLLGLILTDGNLGKNRYSIRIDLQARDRQILDDISLIFGGEVGQRFSKGKLKSCCWGLRVKGFEDRNWVDIYNQLENFHIIPSKTGHEELTILSENLMPYFLRGLWDGDGSFYIRKRKSTEYVLAEFCSSTLLFAQQIRDFLFQIGIKSKIREKKRKNRIHSIFSVELESRPTKQLIEYLYVKNPNGLKLDRKFNIAMLGFTKSKNNNVPVLLTFMRFYNGDLITVEYKSDFEWIKHISNDYYCLKTESIFKILARYKKTGVLTCGNNVSSSCIDCRNCEFLYWEWMRKNKNE